MTNPNDFAAEAAGILYTLEMNGVEVLDGRQDNPVSVPAGGSSEVSVPVTLRWGGGAGALQSILDGRRAAMEAPRPRDRPERPHSEDVPVLGERHVHDAGLRGSAARPGDL